MGLVQLDQINMAMLFWYLLKNETGKFTALLYCQRTLEIGRDTFYKVQEQHGHVHICIWSPCTKSEHFCLVILEPVTNMRVQIT